jgi:hypothetical protein
LTYLTDLAKPKRIDMVAIPVPGSRLTVKLTCGAPGAKSRTCPRKQKGTNIVAMILTLDDVDLLARVASLEIKAGGIRSIFSLKGSAATIIKIKEHHNLSAAEAPDDTAR